MLGSAQLLSSAVGMVRSKLLAVLLGPAGVGLYAQLQTVQDFLAQAVPMGLQLGALRYIAQHRATDRTLVPRYVSTASKAFLCLSAATVAVCLIFLKPLATFTLNDTAKYLYLVPALLAVPFIIQSQLWLLYLRAGLEIKSFSAANILNYVVGLVLCVPLVLLWRVEGAAVVLLLMSVAGYAVARGFAERSMDKELKREIREAPFDLAVLRNLMRFGMSNLPVFVLGMGLPLVLRTAIIKDSGLTANGIFQALWAMSAMFSNLPFNTVGMYLLPRLCQLSKPEEFNLEVNKAMKVTLLLTTFGILTILLSRDFLVRLLFSKRFLPAIDLFPFQMMGDVCKAVVMTVQLPLLQQERFRARNLMNLLQHGVFYAVMFAAPTGQRMQGAVVGNAVCWGLMLPVTLGYMYWLNKYTFDKDNWRLFASSLIAVPIVAFLPLDSVEWRVVGVAIALLWIAVAVRRSDWLRLKEMVGDRLAKVETRRQSEQAPEEVSDD